MSDTKEFSFKVRAEPSGSITNRTNKSKLGDGYSVSSPDGINSELQSWSITVTSPYTKCDGTDGEAVLAFKFIREQAALAKSFHWVTPLGDRIRVESSTITPKKTGAVFSVSTTFTQVYR